MHIFHLLVKSQKKLHKIKQIIYEKYNNKNDELRIFIEIRLE